MSNNLSMNLGRARKAYACADADCGPAEEFAPSSGRDLLARQTGQLLVTLGHMFVNMPAFSSHIDPGTGKLLISLGRKLKTRR